MAKLDFPDPSQSPYEENGYVYEWDGSKWNIAATPGSGVNLTLQDVTDNGNTTTNGATFGGDLNLTGTGDILVGTPIKGNAQADKLTVADDTNAGITIRSGDDSKGSIYFADGTSGNSQWMGYVLYDHSTDAMEFYTNYSGLNNTPALTINPDSSATFKGTVQAASLTDGTTTKTMTEVLAGGGASDLQAVTDAGNTTTNDIVLGDGATGQPDDFGVTIGKNGFISTQRAAANGLNLVFDANQGDTQTISMLANGSATFASSVFAGERDPSNNTDARGVRIAIDSQNGGVYTQCRGDSPGPGSLMAFQALTGDDERFVVKYDGTANFEGDVTLSGGAVGDADDFGVTIAKNGYFAAKRPQYSTNKVFIATRGTTETISMVADGSAVFAGDVISGDNPDQGANDGSRLNPTGFVQASRSGGTGQVWGGFLTGTTAPTSRINADGSASFAGRVDIQRDVDTNAGLTIKKPDGTNAHIFYGSGNVSLADTNFDIYPNGSTFIKNNLTFVGAGNGVRFNNDASHTLSDYEEGTWTPTPGGTATFNTQVGTYTKIGRQVTVVFDVHINAIGSGNPRRIEGLPFSANGRSSGSVSSFQDIATDVNSLACFIDTGSASVITLMAQNDANGGNRNRQVDVFQDGAIVRGAITYFTTE